LPPDSDPSRACVTIKATIKKERPKAVAIETMPLTQPGSLHPLVTRTQSALGRATRTPEGLYHAVGNGMLAIDVGEANRLRALHFMNALLNVLEQRGHRVQSDPAPCRGSGREAASAKSMQTNSGNTHRAAVRGTRADENHCGRSGEIRRPRAARDFEA
jgi:hypothetical protein